MSVKTSTTDVPQYTGTVAPEDERTGFKYKILAMVLVVAVGGLTLFDLVSTFLAYMALVKAAKLQKADDPGASGAPDGLNPLSENEQHALKVTLLSILIVAVIELGFCVVAFYAVTKSHSRGLWVFVGYIVFFLMFKLFSAVYDIVNMIKTKKKGAGIHIGLCAALTAFTGFMLFIFIKHYQEVSAWEITYHAGNKSEYQLVTIMDETISSTVAPRKIKVN